MSFQRRSGRTTWALIRLIGHAIQTGQKNAIFVSPKEPMARYAMEMFLHLISDISKGEASTQINKSRMTVTFMGTVFEFTTLERLERKRPRPDIIIDDHTVSEYYFERRKAENELYRF